MLGAKLKSDSKNYKVFNPEFSESLGNDYSTVSIVCFLHLKKFDDVKRATMNEEKGTRDWGLF